MTHRTQRRSAFSMIELMVAISIIAILAAITLSVGSAVMESADKRKTQDMLSLLDAALVEYEQHTGRPMTFGQGDGPDGQTYDDKPFDDRSRYDIPVRGVYTQTQPDGSGFLEVAEDEFVAAYPVRVTEREDRQHPSLLRQLVRPIIDRAIAADVVPVLLIYEASGVVLRAPFDRSHCNPGESVLKALLHGDTVARQNTVPAHSAFVSHWCI